MIVIIIRYNNITPTNDDSLWYIYNCSWLYISYITITIITKYDIMIYYRYLNLYRVRHPPGHDEACEPRKGKRGDAHLGSDPGDPGEEPWGARSVRDTYFESRKSMLAYLQICICIYIYIHHCILLRNKFSRHLEI